MDHKIVRCAVLLFFLLSMAAVTGVYAQQDQDMQTIEAKVVDAEGQPMDGILLRAMNAGTETFTDEEGNFSLSVISENDRIVIDEYGYKLKIIPITADFNPGENIILETDYKIEGSNQITLPYRTVPDDRSVSGVSSISGEELNTYPTGNVLEALAGRIPGVVVQPASSVPGEESVFIFVRGEVATVYVDGFERNADNLSAKEVDKIQVLKDLASRTALGVSGSGPIIWITTVKGRPNSSEMNISTEAGINTPTVLPQYLGSYDYARLYNEALENDGRTPIYDQEALDAYQSNSNPAQYPNIDYYGRYVRDYSSYRHVNVNFSGVKDNLNYFGYVDYNGSSGLEKVGEQINSDRFKLRGNINFPINDWINMNVRVSGSYQEQRFPNTGDGSNVYNIFSNVLSAYPSNAHPVTHNGSYIISDDFPTNLTNELVFGGFGENKTFTSQNDAELLVDLNDYVEGLAFKGVASFNASGLFGLGKGGTAALYRFVGDSLEQVTPEELDASTEFGGSTQNSNTGAYAQLNYDREFGDHDLALDAVVYRGLIEGQQYQPEKRLDYIFRANYTFDSRYVLQADLSYSGSMRLPEGERFNLYPSVGAAWIASNESFLENSNTVNYLKVYASAAQIGVNDFNLLDYNPYYLYRTTWSQEGTAGFGVPGSGGSSPVMVIQQVGNENIELPEKQYLNAGIQGRVLSNKLSLGFSYFLERNTGLLSTQSNFTPAVIGGDEYLPAVNFGETKEWGVEGSIQFTDNIGDFSYSIGGNALYTRGQYVKVDEPQALADYRKLAGKDIDLIWGYNAESLFQDQSEIDNRSVTQSWGDVQPGDIRYEDYNGDGVVDEQDIHATGAHSPRLFYGLNLSVGYKGFNIFVQGNGVADGTRQLSNPRYFRITGTQQNYSKLMMDRWTPDNQDAEFPRLTTTSQNNVQNSTFWNRSAAYFRVSNVQLSYTLPTSLARQTMMNEWKVFIRGKNLFVASELSEYNIDPANPLAGTWNYPMFRTITGGISVKL